MKELNHTCTQSLRPAASSTRWLRATPCSSRSWRPRPATTITFDKVLAVLDGDKATFGAPVVEGATVEATVVKNGKGKKIRIFKYNPKKGYRKRQGHRQPYTKVRDRQDLRPDMTTVTFHTRGQPHRRL